MCNEESAFVRTEAETAVEMLAGIEQPGLYIPKSMQEHLDAQGKVLY